MISLPLYPVILCGGAGSRLSGETPKQFLRPLGPYSLLQQTVLRALKVTGSHADQITAVTLEAFKETVAAHLAEISKEAVTVLCEREAGGTGAAIGLAARHLSPAYGPGSLLWVLPADHYIENEAALASALEKGLAAAQAGQIVTFGIKPDRPETGYGYIRSGINGKANRFIEKPDTETARQYVASGNYLWNSGMFMAKAETFINALDRFPPQKGQSFDRAVMEKTGSFAVIPCDPGWHDVGTPESLERARERFQQVKSA